MMSVREALEQSYTEISNIRGEIVAWLKVKGPKRRRDFTISTQRLEWVVEDLSRVHAPDLATLPLEVGNVEVCANINLAGKSRATRLDNAYAKMRPALVQLRKANLAEWSTKIEEDLNAVNTFRIPGAFD